MIEITASLIVTSEVLSLGSIERVLGKSKKGHTIGETHSKIRKIRKFTKWELESSSSRSEKLQRHIEELVQFMDRNRNGLAELKSKCKIYVFCMLSSNNGQGGVTMPASTMAKLAEHNVDIAFDIYAETDTGTS